MKTGLEFPGGKEAGALYRVLWISLFIASASVAGGCGTTQSNLATQQMLMSDAVDRAVSQVDFRPLTGKKVYFDDRYILNVKGLGFVNSEYFISALRQQMLAAGCELQEKVTDAEYVVEGRVGALGTDSHDLTYGIPANKALSSGLSVIPNVPDLPSIPEISVARRNDQLGAAKVAVYAYHRETRVPVWQSGTSVALSDARNSWFFGIGPIQTGTIYKGPQLAGERLRALWTGRREPSVPTGVIPIEQAYTFNEAPETLSEPELAPVQPAGHETPATPATPAPSASPAASATPAVTPASANVTDEKPRSPAS